MTYTLAWKEYREHRNIWLAVVLLVACTEALIIASYGPAVLSTPEHEAAQMLAVLMIGGTFTYGLVCGAMMLAGEVENRTLPFLESLPASRLQIWSAKVLAGAGFSLLAGLGVAVVTLALGVSLGITSPGIDAGHWLWILPLVALEAFAWGMFGSSLTRNPLTAVALMVIPLGLWVAGTTSALWPVPIAALLSRSLVALGMLGLSAYIFCHPQTTRRARSTAGAPAQERSTRQAGVLLWLAFRQGGAEMAALTIAAVLAGLLLPAGGLGLWLTVTLFVGVMCGTAAFRDEQASGANRFLGDQRLPRALFAAVKLGVWFIVALFLYMPLLTGAAITAVRAAPSMPREHDFSLWLRVLGEAVFQQGGVVLLLIGPLVGFPVGALFTLTSRKPAVSTVMALMVGAVLIGAWTPSALCGGLSPWWLLPIPAVLIGVAFLLLRAWVTDRVTPVKVALALGACAVFAAGWTAGMIAYRVHGVPDGREPFDVKAWIATIPTPEKNESGRLVKSALPGMSKQVEEASQKVTLPPDKEEAGGGMPMPGGAGMIRGEGSPTEWTRKVVATGWSVAPRELGTWLDVAFEGEWSKQIADAEKGPVGMIEDPRSVHWNRRSAGLDEFTLAASLLVARGLQIQAKGDDAAGLDQLIAALELARPLRNKGRPLLWVYAAAVEKTALQGLGHWLEKAGKKPDLVRKALEALTRHEQEMPPASEAVKAEYVALQGGLGDLSNTAAVMEALYESRGAGDREKLLLWSWETPWEKARVERLFNAVFAGYLRAAETDYPTVAKWAGTLNPPTVHPRLRFALTEWLPPERDTAGLALQARLAREVGDSRLVALFLDHTPFLQGHAVALSRLRGMRLEFAVALYQLTEGKPPPTLTALMPRYLSDVPTDPLTGEPYQYWISEGEKSPLPTPDAPEGREIAPGQAVIRSRGKYAELLFIVPRP